MPNRNSAPPRSTAADHGRSSAVTIARPNAIATPEQRRDALREELISQLAIMEASAAVGIEPRKMAALALTHFSRTPGLWDCTPQSIARCVVEAAQYGLDMIFGSVYLVPFRNRNNDNQKEAQLILGYRGLATLARRSGEVTRIRARVVHAKDEFAYGYGLREFIDHIPHQPRTSDPADLDPGPMTHAYAIAEFRDGGTQFDVMTAAEIYTIRDRSKGSHDDRGNLTGPWLTDEGEMAKKTPLRRLSKSLPLTTEAREALEAEDRAEANAAPVVVSAGASRSRELTSRVQAQLTGGPAVDVPSDPGPGSSSSDAGPGTSSSDQPDAPAADPQTAAGGPPPPPPTAPAAVPACGKPSPFAEGDRCAIPPHPKGSPHDDGSGRTWL